MTGRLMSRRSLEGYPFLVTQGGSRVDRAIQRPIGKTKSEFANAGEVKLADVSLPRKPQGREPGTRNDNPSVADEALRVLPVSARRRCSKG